MNNKDNKNSQIITLGSGPAGCTAAIYAARANLSTILIAGSHLGGQLVNSASIENWPNIITAVPGMDLMNDMIEHAKKYDKVNFVYDNAIDINFNFDGGHSHQIICESNTYTAQAVIIATGKSPKLLGIKSEQQYLGKGVSTCAVCDGYFHKNSRVIIIGGGNSAIDDALYLADIARETIIVHRRSEFRAEKTKVDKLLLLEKLGKIKIIFNHTLKEIIGDGQSVKGVVLESVVQRNNSNTSNAEINTKLLTIDNISGVFVAVGSTPNSELFRGKIVFTDNQNIQINGKISDDNFFSATSIPGVFAAGDVTNSQYNQAINAAAFGCMAAMDAIKYLATLNLH